MYNWQESLRLWEPFLKWKILREFYSPIIWQFPSGCHSTILHLQSALRHLSVHSLYDSPSYLMQLQFTAIDIKKTNTLDTRPIISVIRWELWRSERKPNTYDELPIDLQC